MKNTKQGSSLNHSGMLMSRVFEFVEQMRYLASQALPWGLRAQQVVIRCLTASFVMSVMLFCFNAAACAQPPRPPLAVSTPTKTGSISKPGMATNEVDSWKAQLETHKDDVRKVRGEIGNLTGTFRSSTDQLRQALTRYKQDGDQ